ncbi:hypothetical protein CEXT_788771 [Caerostris extrusa]|uniref:Uncharacterized protein n=1 Tax=Caerostris extrusa TaxID=172846 RepID=A0AAV4XTM6_CAEEX|nr:hypothetical protein CEXT_788771 [Caerostris extrusa]
MNEKWNEYGVPFLDVSQPEKQYREFSKLTLLWKANENCLKVYIFDAFTSGNMLASSNSEFIFLPESIRIQRQIDDVIASAVLKN